MRVAAIYDIHGNLPALEAVLAEIREADVDRVVVGGDVVPGPMPAETIDRLLSLDTPLDFIQGNGDREIVGWRNGNESSIVPEQFRESMRWVARTIRAEQADLLARWPSTLQLDISGLGRVLFCHATPRNDTEIFTKLTSEDRLRPVFSGVDAQVVVCGHTHMQFDRTIGNLRVVNAGSVGMPFQEPGAYWAVLGPTIELRRTPYDFEAAAQRIRQTAYPQASEFAAGNVLQPPSEAQILESFSKFELTP